MKTSKMILALASAVGLLVTSARAQEGGGCDGPVSHSASTTGCCDCETPGCLGPVETINDWYSCGGNTAQTCLSVSGEIGNTRMCNITGDPEEYGAALDAYIECMLDEERDDCVMPHACDYMVYALGDPDPITDNVYGGSDGECNIAKLNDAPLLQKIALLFSSRPSA